MEPIKLQEVPVRSLKDLAHLQGDAADIRVDADISPTSFSGPLALFQFTKMGSTDGMMTIIPTDTVSLELASLYAQTEYIRVFDAAAGFGSAVTYPRKIALMDRATVSDTQKNIENNAMYLGTSDATVIVKYSLDLMPISVNAGIMAHEHFHSLFQSLVLNPLAKPVRGAAHLRKRRRGSGTCRKIRWAAFGSVYGSGSYRCGNWVCVDTGNSPGSRETRLHRE